MDEERIAAEVLTGIGAVAADEWDACAGGDNPFLAHAFLSALEESGAVAAETGWLPQHVILRAAAGRLRAAMPCYLKSHSLGEYVFDQAWAEAWERAGGRYYPKLQIAVPFTPVPGPRLLVRPRARRPEQEEVLLAAAIALMEQRGVSSVHLTFLPESEAVRARQAGFLLRTDQQFHWHNRGYRSFGDFLASLASRKRKQIRRERRAVRESGLDIETRVGRDIRESDLDAFFAFYLDTGRRKWGRPYLNRHFFSLLRERMADAMLLTLACRHNRPVAGALHFRGGETLYGRYWGCLEHHPFLHFELCYYRAIAYAIEQGLARVEAGAQGPHKIARGYEPVTTYSAHRFADPRLHAAVADYLVHERAEVAAAMAALSHHLPFRKSGTGGQDT
ncbi:MAG: GNAT family N-acetyltransferase [Rhodothalassiaceae bacterium]